MMNYQYGYNNQPAFVQPQHQQVHSTQAYQGQPSSQQQQFYPSPYARIQPQQQQQQQRQQPQYAPQTGVAASMGDGGGGVGGGGMMPVGMPQQHQQHMANHQSPYSNAPYSQSNLSNSTRPPQQQYQQASPPISPPQHQSPRTYQPTSQRPMTTQTHAQGSVLSPAPAQPQSQQSQQPQSQPQPQPQKPVLQPPLSPTFATREKNRVSALLDLNRLLIQEVAKLQAQGKVLLPDQPPNERQPSSSTQPQGQGQGLDGETNKPKHTPEFIECMRRLQSNLAYLANIADRSHKPASAITNAPAIVDAPPQYPNFEESYAKLRELFPGAKTITLQPQQQRTGRAALGGMMPPGTGTMAHGMQGAVGMAGRVQRAG